MHAMDFNAQTRTQVAPHAVVSKMSTTLRGMQFGVKERPRLMVGVMTGLWY